ncbi:MAG: hypothetical protein ABJH68_05845 [Ilumatobacter sp.]|uniref:hypothetical protein n=1 Tax=Ilumatobacter sp. TaxID=1967498 RepID=UPI00329706A4
MSEPLEARWKWEQTDPDRSGSSGDLAKLFKNETVKNPGVFAATAPSEHATLMAREVIQNSSDAASELSDELGDDAPEFEITFEFESLTDEAKSSLVKALDLSSIAARGTNPADPGWRSRLGLDSDDLLDHLHDSAPLRTLKVVESGTTGMYGPFNGAKSKMYLALISLGYTAKASGAGGSYGYGKAGLIRGSAIRTVVAYSAFRERPDDPGVTRRLLGMTYWGQHDLDDLSYTGFARFGAEQVNGAIRPFENDDADSMAERLGIDLRCADDLEDLGTTFLLIEPTVEPDDLSVAVARNWWPALEDGRMTVMVSADGRTSVPRPMKDPILKTFVDAYHLAATDQDNAKPNQYRQSFRRGSFGERTLKLGSLGLVAETGGWSYESGADEPDDVQHRSLVALVRGPRMVVEYLDAGQARPFVRGAFIADDEVDELLRQTEPKAHDSWQTRIEEAGSDPDAPRVADAVINRVRDHVRKFRDQLRPATRPAEDVRLPELERLFGRIFSSSSSNSSGPPQSERPFSIVVEERLEHVGDGLIRVKARIGFALSPHFGDPEEVVDVSLSYRFVEEGGNGEEAELDVVAPEGFEARDEKPYVYRGALTHDRVVFEFASVPYPADWTGRIKGDVEFTSEKESVG